MTMNEDLEHESPLFKLDMLLSDDEVVHVDKQVNVDSAEIFMNLQE